MHGLDTDLKGKATEGECRRATCNVGEERRGSGHTRVEDFSKSYSCGGLVYAKWATFWRQLDLVHDGPSQLQVKACLQPRFYNSQGESIIMYLGLRKNTRNNLQLKQCRSVMVSIHQIDDKRQAFPSS